MPDNIILEIDGLTATAAPGTTVLKAAESIGIAIPTICYHTATTSNALCRICVVEVEGARTLIPACVGVVSSGMKVHTQSERVRLARQTILEMLVSSVDLGDSPEIQQMLLDYQVKMDRFPDAEERMPAVKDDNSLFIRDYAKCILCWRCVQVCAQDAQYAFAINFSGRGYETQISTFFDQPLTASTCVFCGQCVGVCPTGALKPKKQWLMEQGMNSADIMSQTRTERSEPGRRKKRRNAVGGE